MFPFTLAGPQFLAFYAVLAALTLFFYWVHATSGRASAMRLSELTADPYRIAYLRDGPAEAMRLAIFNLIDRGLLKWDGGLLKVAALDSAAFVRRDLDRAILEQCAAAPRSPLTLLRSGALARACEPYQAELEARGLLPDETTRRARTIGLAVVLAVLLGVAGLRLLQAFSRGQGNVLFLILLAAAAVWLAWRIFGGRITTAGRQALDSLKTLLSARSGRRVEKLVPGGATNEVLIFASVLGLAALPAPAFPFIAQVFPKPVPQGSGSSRDGGSCGSGGSCGGSCGGGGCGGCGG